MKSAMSKLLIECFATMLFTMMFMTGNMFIMLLGLWILTVFCWKISGSHLNPAITFAYMFRKDPDAKHMGLPLGLLYISAQFAGAYCGALLMGFFTWGVVVMKPVDNDEIFPAMMQEMGGTFLLCVFFMMQTDERMHFSKEPAINCFIIASAYVGSRAVVNGTTMTISTYGACMNPAVAIGIILASIFSQGGQALTYVWIYPVMPLAGSVLGILFYEFVYKKTQMMLKETRTEHDYENGVEQ